MTQCAVEERRNLELAIRGLVTYAETLSVYGTEPVFVDGDDTPWSKAFLGAAYASRGVKVRFTSGTGSEALMGHAQGLLDALPRGALPRGRARGRLAGRAERLDLVRRARRSRVPGGTRAILAENVLAAWLDLEVASRQRRDRLALRDPQDREADGPVPAGHGLRHLGLLGHAAPRQHVRRRQLRRRRPRRVADDPARLAGRRRASSRSPRTTVPRRARARGARPSRPCSPSSASRRSPTRRSRRRSSGYDSRDLPDRDRARGRRGRRRALLARGRLRPRRGARARPARLRRRRRGGRRDAAPARRRPTTSRPRR